MKKILFFAVAFSTLVSCQSLIEEFQPVFTSEYNNPEHKEAAVIDGPITPIADLVSEYNQGGKFIGRSGQIISGIVSTTDQPGNFYKSFYIQDGTGGMEIKIGKNGLYNDYLPGQRIYVDCEDLSIGMYGYKEGDFGGMGMVQVGFSSTDAQYETSYLEVPLLIDRHVIKGAIEGKVTPVVLAESDIPGSNDTQVQNSNIGKLVTIRGLRYGGAEEDLFVLLYIDSNKDKKSSSNRIFISGTQSVMRVNTWAMSKEKMTSYLNSGVWDDIKIGNANDQNYGKVGGLKDENGNYAIEKNAYSVSQYFRTAGGKEIELRTSGYCKFADMEIPEEVLNGSKTVDITGVLTLYQGSIQLVVNDITDIKIN